MEKITLRQTLYVGLGGTGATAILKAKRNFMDAYGEIPPMIGFLEIDTNNHITEEEVSDKYGKPVTFDPNEVLVISVQRAMAVYAKHTSDFDWIPGENVPYLSSIAAVGAGQIRTNGRFILKYHNKQVNTWIENGINKIKTVLPPDSRFELAAGKNKLITIHVVGSIAGGTGSGMLLEMLEILTSVAKNKDLDTTIFPWIVMPDIFRAIAPGPGMLNTFSNACAALTELDYDMHPKDTKEALAKAAFIVNYTNKAGISFPSMSSLTDMLGKALFLPATSMGKEFEGPFDNILNNRQILRIQDKQAWAVSCGCADIKYDNHLVAEAWCAKLVSELCYGLTTSIGNDGVADANTFVDKLRIRENSGHDDVIDEILSPSFPPFVEVTADTKVNEIEEYFNTLTNTDKSTSVEKKSAEKLARTKEALREEVANQLKQLGGTAKSIAFLKGLQEIIRLCSEELQSEVDKHEATLTSHTTTYWKSQLQSVINTGLRSIFVGQTNPQAVEIVQEQIQSHARDKRNILRKGKAILFYADLSKEVQSLLNNVAAIDDTLKRIKDKEETHIHHCIQAAKNSTDFAIYLHDKALDNMAYTAEEREALVRGFIQNHSTELEAALIKPDALHKVMVTYCWANDNTQAALRVTVEDVLRSKSEEDIRHLLQHVREKAAPFWKWDTQGYTAENFDTTEYIIVGVENPATTLLKENDYAETFKSGVCEPVFVSTNSTDSITIMRIENLLPIYAVSNFRAYYNEMVEKMKNGAMHPFSDINLYNKMQHENFKVFPTLITDTTLQSWVKGFIFRQIDFDPDNTVYYTHSKKHGKRLKSFRIDLGKDRKTAFEQFKALDIATEIEEYLQEQIKQHGLPWYKDQIEEAVTPDMYYNEKDGGLSQTSPTEILGIQDGTPLYKTVEKLLEDEIDTLNKLLKK